MYVYYVYVLCIYEIKEMKEKSPVSWGASRGHTWHCQLRIQILKEPTRIMRMNIIQNEYPSICFN